MYQSLARPEHVFPPLIWCLGPSLETELVSIKLSKELDSEYIGRFPMHISAKGEIEIVVKKKLIKSSITVKTAPNCPKIIDNLLFAAESVINVPFTFLNSIPQARN